MERKHLIDTIVKAIEKAGGRVYLCRPVKATDDFLGGEEIRQIRYLQKEPGTVPGCMAVEAGGFNYPPFGIDGMTTSELKNVVSAL